MHAAWPINGIARRDATNWEDAFYRAFYAENGQTYQFNGNPAAPAPELVVFFTDGLPTYDRTDDRTGPTTPAATNPANGTAFAGSYDGSAVTQFNPQAWFRANWILGQNSTIPVIGVGVGTAFTLSTNLHNDTDLSNSEINQWGASVIPAQLLLGDLIAGNIPTTWTTGSPMSARFKGVAWSASEPTNGGWGDISQADILTTTDFTKFGSALEQIALGECGGTLTVQTRLLSTGAPVPTSITYEVSGDDHPITESTTSAVNKTGVFDIATEGAATEQVLLRPRPLAGSGYQAHHWECRSRNAVISNPSKVSLANPADQAAGLNVVVAANEALACVMYVVPE